MELLNVDILESESKILSSKEEKNPMQNVKKSFQKQYSEFSCLNTNTSEYLIKNKQPHTKKKKLSCLFSVKSW